ncbi:MAG: radical SAM protein [bacterium]|nr:radical SAM protein [bacterium]
MRLEDIGFYTLSDSRAANASATSPLYRNEMIITSRCNFSCPYCRGTEINGKKGDMPLSEIKSSIDIWASQDIKNVRYSGGEPTIHQQITDIIKYTKKTCKKIEHIAMSTNGSSDLELYKELIDLGVNDYSISLDACCSSVGDMMAGGISGSWDVVVSNIIELSKLTYVTVGMVFDRQNAHEIQEAILFASSLGVSDIRIISAAQWDNFAILENLNINKDILDKHPILKYRINNFRTGRNVRGIKPWDSHKCGLMIDDTVIKGKRHYPCVIKMREGCSPIGVVSEHMRQDRAAYLESLDTYADPICQQNCLDVCVDYNNKYEQINTKKEYKK